MNWLFSFQGSGSNYLRYCIEFLSKLPTQGPIRLLPHDKEYILMRSHHVLDLPNTEKIVILLRNPFELIFRENIYWGIEKNLFENMHTVCGRYQSFIEKFPNAKIFYYEEIIDDFNKIKEMIKFYDIPLTESLNEFEHNLDHHKIISYNLGNEFYSDKSNLFYSKNLSEENYNTLYSIIISYPNDLVNLLSIYFR